MSEHSYLYAIEQLMAEAIEAGSTHGIQLHIDSPKLGIHWEGGVGCTDRAHNESRASITPLHPIRVASNTKTFIAAAVLRMYEQQQVSLDESVRRYICAEHAALIQDKGYALDNITVRHLLTHTSGLKDYADNTPYLIKVTENPSHEWTRTEQLQYAMTWGEPCGNPGEVYHYNDTGYILLGEIIENIYGKPLGIALNELLCFERLGINTTWIEKQQASRSALFPQVHQYNGDVDFNTIDATWDLYGGGGLVSTVGDLARFTRALFTHQIYQSPDTLKIMLSTVENAQGGSIAYGRLQVAGVYRMGIESAYNGRVYSHTGYLGTYAGYVPSHDLTLSLSFSEHNTERRKALIESIYTLFSIAP